MAVALVIALCVAPSAGAATPLKDIGLSAGPLTQIAIGNELSCQSKHRTDTSFEYFPPSTAPGDCGTFVAVDGQLFTPDFSNHGSTATSSLGTRTPYAPVSQTEPSGTGTKTDPRRVTTTVTLPGTGITLIENDLYVAGQEYYRTTVTFNNASGQSKPVVLYRAGDCYLQNSDLGFGFATRSHTVGCSFTQRIPPRETPPGRVLSWTPDTGTASYLEDSFSHVWAAIALRTPFANACNQCANKVDNGAGLSWAELVRPGNATSIETSASGFSPTGALPPQTHVGTSSTQGTSPTHTDVICTFRYSSEDDLCTATVGPTSKLAAAQPTGIVKFAGAAGGRFPDGDTCKLVGTGPNTSSCAVRYLRPYEVPPARSFPVVNATYTGETPFLPSAGQTSLKGCVVNPPGVDPLTGQQQRLTSRHRARAALFNEHLLSPTEKQTGVQGDCYNSVPSVALLAAAPQSNLARSRQPWLPGIIPYVSTFFGSWWNFMDYALNTTDPVDPRFRHIVRPRKVRPPRLVRRGRRGTRLERAFDAFFANEAKSLSLQRAQKTSIIRAQTAWNAGSHVWSRRQMLAAAGFTARIAKLRRRHLKLARGLAHRLRSSHADVRLNPRAARRALRRLRRRGFSRSTTRGLVRLFGRRRVNHLRSQALRIEPGSAHTTLSKLILRMAAKDRQDAHLLSLMARRIRANPSAAPPGL